MWGYLLCGAHAGLRQPILHAYLRHHALASHRDERVSIEFQVARLKS